MNSIQQRSLAAGSDVGDNKGTYADLSAWPFCDDSAMLALFVTNGSDP